jgi:serine/threonine-protein kinase RIO1
MEAFAFLGRPSTRSGDKPRLWAYEKALDIYEVVTQFYWSRCSSSPKEKEVFHLAHGDLSDHNILVDPDSGAITGVLNLFNYTM